MKNHSRRFNLLAAALILGGFCSAHAQTLLSYWNFNNDNPAYANSLLGSFNSSAAAYGETYTTNSLSSNTANGTVFHSGAIAINFSNLSQGVNNANVNGITASGTHTPTNTSFGGYGVYADSTLNRVSGDTTTGGSLIIMNPGNSENNHYITFSLSSDGYSDLSLTYATRLSNGFAGSEVWSYSLDGTNFFNLGSISPTADATFRAASLNLSALSSNALNDQDAFYLRMTINTPNGGGSYAFDNIQITGVVPEPHALGLLALGMSGLFLFRNRRRAPSLKA